MTTEPYVRACIIAQLDWERSVNGHLPEGEGARIVKEAYRLTAKIKADALREAAGATRGEAGEEPYAGCTFGAHAAWLDERADRIEKDAEA